MERRIELINGIASLMEGGIEDKERNVQGVKQNGTGSSEVGITSLEEVVRPRSRVIIIEEEV